MIDRKSALWRTERRTSFYWRLKILRGKESRPRLRFRSLSCVCHVDLYRQQEVTACYRQGINGIVLLEITKHMVLTTVKTYQVGMLD